jgi:uncharacterized protein YcaQ
MHPRAAAQRIAGRNKRERALIEYVRERGEVHPRDVQRHFSHGTVTNYWGGSSNATTHLLVQLHYRGVFRIARRDGGIRVYAIREQVNEPLDRVERDRRIDALIDVLVHKYAPLPGSTLAFLVRRLRYGVPQWERELGRALIRTRARLPQVRIGKIDWYWPAGESLVGGDAPEVVRLLAPFDPLVWDRDRFTALWGWAYRFEAYAGAEAQVRVLRAAAALARPRHRLGQPLDRTRRTECPHRLRRGSSAARTCVQTRARCGTGSNADVSRPDTGG